MTMKKEDYLKTVTEQMRCQKARKMVADELESHIDDQTDAFTEMGMEPDEALEKAVAEMGDPVETGVMLDHAHRPEMAWSMIVLIAAVSVISILVQYIICTGSAGNNSGTVIKQAASTAAGFAVMIGIYFLDYSTIAKYAKPAAAVFLGFQFVNIFFTGTMVNGASNYMKIGKLTVSLSMLMFLFIPLYGALLYLYRGGGYKALLKSILWMLLPAVLSFCIPSLAVAVNLFAVMFVMLTIALVKGWFHVNKRAVIGVSWSLVIGLPAALTAAALTSRLSFLAEYQTMRIQAWIHPELYDQGYTSIRETLETSRLIGQNKESLDMMSSWWQNRNTDYILMHITTYYGILAAAALIILLAWLIFKIFRISAGQKNQLGMLMGCGCGLVFGSQTLFYVLQNFGFLPPTSVYLPLFSYGGTGTIVSYILLGILLSIHRYQNILPAEIKCGRKAEVPALKNE